MSEWHQIETNEIKIDGDEISFYVGYNDFGSIYGVIKIKDLKEFIEVNNL